MDRHDDDEGDAIMGPEDILRTTQMACIPIQILTSSTPFGTNSLTW
jgi:hypothetical protein